MSARQGVQYGLAIAGLAVGLYLGNPQLGLAIGTVLGAVVANAAFPLDPVVNRQDNIADMALTSAAIGQFRPIIYGSWPVGGNIIWAYPLIAIDHEDSENVGGGLGKGGFGGQKYITVTTTYRRHLQVALCEGPVARLTRIYLDATMIYDEAQPEGWLITAGARNGDPGTDEDPGEGIPDTIIYEKSTETTLQKFILFRGTPTQEPWAFAETLDDIEAGTIPAYRGTVVVACTLDLGSTGRLPNLRFEVSSTLEGLGVPINVYYFAGAGSIWTLWKQGPRPVHGAGYAIQYDVHDFAPIGLRNLSRDAVAAPAGDRSPVDSAAGQTSWAAGAIYILRQDATIAVMPTAGRLLFDSIDPRTEEETAGEDEDEAEVDPPTGGRITVPPSSIAGLYTTVVYTLPNKMAIGQAETHLGDVHNFQRLALGAEPLDIIWNPVQAAIYVSLPSAGAVAKVTGYAPIALTDTISCGVNPTTLLADVAGTCWVTDRDAGDVYHFTSAGDVSSPIAVGVAPDDLTEATDGFIWVANTGEPSVCRINPSDDSVETFPIPAAPARIKGAFEDGACWILSAANRTAMLMQTDGTFESIQIPRGPSDIAIDDQGNAWIVCSTARIVVRVSADATEMLQPEIGNGLACVVRDINRRAGVPAEWIDVSGLDSSPVNYPIFGMASAARALEDLAMAYQFIAVETGTGIKYIFKGGASVATIAESATLATDSDGAGSLTVERAQPQELPTEVTVVYASPARHFHTDEQMVQRPADGPRIPVVQQVPCAFHDAQYPRNLAEILLYEPNFARYAATVQLPAKAARIEPGDLVTLTTTDGHVYDVRLLKSTAGADNRVEWDTVRHRSYLYEGFQSFPAESQPGETVIPVAASVQLHLVEMPPLPGDAEGIRLFFAVSRRPSGGAGTFPTTLIYESTDNEATYHQVGMQTTAAMVGVVAAILPDGAVDSWDYTTTIDVVLRPGSNALSAATQEAPHYALLGAECLAFVEADLIGTRTYRLSILRRGVRGSEQHTHTHVANERFVLLTPALRNNFLALTPAAYGQTRHYKVVPAGSNIADAAGQPYTIRAVFGKPWAPLLLSVTRDGGTGDWTMTWLHRSRVRGSWVNNTGITYDTDDTRDYIFRFYNGFFFSTVTASRITDVYPNANTLRTFVYTEAMQIEDFGIAQPAIYFGLSARVPGIPGYEARYGDLTGVTRPIWTADFSGYTWPPGTPTPVWYADFLTAYPVWFVDTWAGYALEHSEGWEPPVYTPTLEHAEDWEPPIYTPTLEHAEDWES